MIQKTTFVIALALLSLAGLTIARAQIANELPDSQYVVRTSVDDVERRTSSYRLDASPARNFKVDLEFGEVEIVAGSGSEFRAEVTKEINRPLDADEKQWLETEWIQAKREGDTLVLSEIKGKKPNLNNRTTKRNRNINVKVKIQVPQGMNANLEMMAGTLRLDGNYRSVHGHLNAGEVITSNFSSDQSISLDIDAGEVSANLTKAPSGDSNIDVNVGQISLDLNGNASVDAKVGIGNIEVKGESDDKDNSLGAHRIIRVGSGGTHFRLKVDAGEINVGQGKTERRIKSEEIDTEGEIDHDIDADVDQDDLKGFHFQGDLGKDFEKDIKAAMEAATKSVAQAMKEVEKNLKDVKIDDKEIQKEIERALREAHKESTSAMAEAQREIEKARIEMQKHKDCEKEMTPEIRAIAKDAMRIAQEALTLAQKEIQKALKKGLKDRGHEPA